MERNPLRYALILALTATIALVWASAEAWSAAYDRALSAASSGQWAEAREFFRQAVASRAADQARPTVLPGPVTEPNRWRNGSPYSPNFGAAYSAYRMALSQEDKDERERLLMVAADELKALVALGQTSPETLGVLGDALTRLGKADEKAALPAAGNWAVDLSFVAAEHQVARTAPAGNGGSNSAPAAGGNAPRPNTPATQQGGRQAPPRSLSGTPGGQIVRLKAGEEDQFFSSISTGPVATIDTKFALVIGNSDSALEDLKVPFAASDADLVREALVNTAGYPEANVTVVKNGTAAQMLTAAQELAARMPENATVLIYFSGVGVHIDGKDYFAGTNTEFVTDTTTMVGKSDLMRLFLAKGSRIFAFYQVNRPITDGLFFGLERSLVGAISEAQATVAGSNVFSKNNGTQEVGLYTGAFTAVLNQFRSNQVPISDFVWQVFQTVRRGISGTGGGGSVQTPTLPVITNMGDDARF